MRKIGYVSYADDPTDPDPDLDIPFLVPALQANGYEVSVIDWEQNNDFAQFDVLLIRSPWNYSRDHLKFLSWLSNAESQVKVINPPAVIRANMDKRYLFDLAERGIPVIPTSLLVDTIQFKNIEHYERMVFKPVVGAGARGAFTASGIDEAEWKVRKHFENSEIGLLAQPYLAEVDSIGEIAVVCSNGEPLHAITKRPALSAGGHGDFTANTKIDQSLIEFVSAIQELDFAGSSISSLLYSRVDVVPTSSGYQLMELELFEPTLFLHENPTSVDKFVRNLIEHLT